MKEEVFVVDDLTTGTIKVVRDLKEIPKGSGIITHRIKAKEIEIENWEITR